MKTAATLCLSTFTYFSCVRIRSYVCVILNSFHNNWMAKPGHKTECRCRFVSAWCLSWPPSQCAPHDAYTQTHRPIADVTRWQPISITAKSIFQLHATLGFMLRTYDLVETEQTSWLMRFVYAGWPKKVSHYQIIKKMCWIVCYWY